MKFELMPPSRCTAKLPDNFEKDYLVAEEKLDGSRYVLYIGGDPYERNSPNALLSRRVSEIDDKHVDRTKNVPHITAQSYSGLEGTVLDGEIMAENFLQTNSVMNSGPALAIQKQEQYGKVVYHVFDVMSFRGIDVRGKSLADRRKILEYVVAEMNNEFVKAIAQVQGDIESYFKEVVGKGGEGLIIKDLRMGYGIGWAKMKKSYDVSCVISGFKSGNGKYSGSVGAIALSVYHEDKLVEIGFASGFDDAMRNQMAKNPEKFIGKVVDIFAHEIQVSKRSSDNPVGRLRHPTFYRFREDLNPKTVTSEKLKQDLKSKVRNQRNKFGGG